MEGCIIRKNKPNKIKKPQRIFRCGLVHAFQYYFDSEFFSNQGIQGYPTLFL